MFCAYDKWHCSRMMTTPFIPENLSISPENSWSNPTEVDLYLAQNTVYACTHESMLNVPAMPSPPSGRPPASWQSQKLLHRRSRLRFPLGNTDAAFVPREPTKSEGSVMLLITIKEWRKAPSTGCRLNNGQQHLCTCRISSCLIQTYLTRDGCLRATNSYPYLGIMKCQQESRGKGEACA